MHVNNKAFFIINKHSGTGYQSDLENKILSHCKRNNLDAILEFTREPGHGTVLAKAAVEKDFKVVFAVGGDGTVNEVAQGLLHSRVPLGILPKGSGNGLARHLKIPININRALQVLDLEKTIAIDTFTINDSLSINVSGIGFDGHIAGLFAKGKKRGLTTYVRLVTSEFTKFKPFQCQLFFDGKVVASNPFIVSLANSSQFGNNAVIAPYASICDQQIDVCLVNKMNAIQSLFFARKLFNGTLHQSRYVHHIKTNEIKITTSEKIAYHVDGEAFDPVAEFMVKVSPASLLMITPKESKSI